MAKDHKTQAENDRDAIVYLARAIVKNQWLSWEIVNIWLTENQYRLITPGEWRKIQQERGQRNEKGPDEEPTQTGGGR